MTRFVFRSGFIMKPLMQAAKADPKRVVYAEGEDERVLRAVQTVVEEGIALPILIGRPRRDRAPASNGSACRSRPERDFTLVNPQDDPRYRDYVATYLDAAGRHGVTPDAARTLVRTNSTVIAALAVRRGDADAMLCGLDGRFNSRLAYIRDIIGLAPGVTDFSAMSLMITSKGAFFITDTHVRHDPADFEIAETALMCARHVRRFGLEPKHRPRLAFGLRHGRRALGAQDAARRWRFCARARPTSKSTAKCRPTRRCRRRSAIACCRPRASRARPMSSSCRISTPPTSPIR